MYKYNSKIQNNKEMNIDKSIESGIPTYLS